MSIFGKKILSAANKKAAASNRNSSFKSFAQAERIGILYSWEGESKESLITDFAASMNGKSVEMLCFSPDKRAVLATENPAFSKADLSMFGKITSEAVLSFINKDFDYLFHLDFKLNEITKSVIVNSKAHWKIGHHSDSGEGIYDLMIKINESAGFSSLTDQMLIYVNALK